MTDKFKEKNKEELNKLDVSIEENKDKIRCILVSAEMRSVLDDSSDNEIPKYKGLQLVMDPYFPSGYLKIVKKGDEILFKTPCLCGIYADEKHP